MLPESPQPAEESVPTLAEIIDAELVRRGLTPRAGSSVCIIPDAFALGGQVLMRGEADPFCYHTRGTCRILENVWFHAFASVECTEERQRITNILLDAAQGWRQEFRLTSDHDGAFRPLPPGCRLSYLGEFTVRRRGEKPFPIEAMHSSTTGGGGRSLKLELRGRIHMRRGRSSSDWRFTLGNERGHPRSLSHVRAGRARREAEVLIKEHPGRADVLAELYVQHGPVLDDISEFARIVLREHKKGHAAPAWTTSPKVHIDGVPEYPGHFLHTSPQEPALVRYYQDLDKLRREVVTPIKPGAYLRKYFPHLGDARIKELANIHVEANKPRELKFARSEAECIRVIAEGPTMSCMSNGYHDSGSRGRKNYDWFKGHIHPAAVYGYADDNNEWMPDTEVLYLEDEDGAVIARTICHKRTRECARIYGDARLIERPLELAGYTVRSYALLGARIRRIENEEGPGFILPYIDAGTAAGGGELRVKEDGGDYWVITDDRGCLSTYIAVGRGISTDAEDEDEDEDEDEERYPCDDCGDHVHENDLHSVGVGQGRTVCSDCQANYIEVRCATYNGRRTTAWLHEDADCIVYYDDEAYDRDALDAYDLDFCAESGDVYHTYDLVDTTRGLIGRDLARHINELDDEGNEYAYIDDAVETTDGRYIHEDQAVECTYLDETFHCDDPGIVHVMQTERSPWNSREYSVRVPRHAADVAVSVSLFFVRDGSLLPSTTPVYGAIPLAEYVRSFPDWRDTLPLDDVAIEYFERLILNKEDDTTDTLVALAA